MKKTLTIEVDRSEAAENVRETWTRVQKLAPEKFREQVKGLLGTPAFEELAYEARRLAYATHEEVKLSDGTKTKRMRKGITVRRITESCLLIGVMTGLRLAHVSTLKQKGDEHAK